MIQNGNDHHHAPPARTDYHGDRGLRPAYRRRGQSIAAKATEATTAMTARIGTVPTTAERVELLERLLAEALARIEVLEDQLVHQAHEDEDGPAPAVLPPNWKPLKQAAPIVGYSEPGLRKAMRRHTDGPRWWRYVGARLLIDVDRCPRRPVRT
jgi:hypothetical protein